MASAAMSMMRRAGRRIGQALGIGGNSGPQDILPGVLTSSWGSPPLVNTRAMLEAPDTMPLVRMVADRVGLAMGLTDWRLYAVGAPAAPKTSLEIPDGARYEFDVDELASMAGQVVAAEVARRIRVARGKLEPWARRDHITQRAVPEQRWKNMDLLRKRGQLVEIAEHPFYDALQNPNPFMDRMGLMKITETSLDLVGDAFWLKQRNGAGAPAGFWPVPAHWVVQTPTPMYPWFRVSWRGWQRTIPEAEFVWFHEPAAIHPYDRGSGIGFAIGDELEVDEYLAKMTKQLFFNDAKPDWIFAVPGNNETEARRLERDIIQRHQGFWRKFKPYFFAGGSDDLDLGKKIHEFQRPTMEQLVYPGLRKTQRDIVIQTWGIPPEMFGIHEGGVLARTNYEGAEYICSKWVFLPRAERLRSVLQYKLLPDYDDRLLLDFPSPVAADKEFELSVRKAAAWAFDADEWRHLAGEHPMENGKGKVFLVPLNSHTTTDLTDATQRPQGAAAGGAPPAADAESGAPKE